MAITIYRLLSIRFDGTFNTLNRYYRIGAVDSAFLSPLTRRSVLFLYSILY